MISKVGFYIQMIFAILCILFPEMCFAGPCLAIGNSIGQPHVRSVRNRTELNIEVPFVYNGCEGGDVTILAGLLDAQERGSIAISEQVQISGMLGTNRVALKLQVPEMPFNAQSHKIVIVMSAQLGGNTGKHLFVKKFEYRPRHLSSANSGRTSGNQAQNNRQNSSDQAPDLCIITVRQFPPNIVPKTQNVYFEVLVGNQGGGPCMSAINIKGPEGVQRISDSLKPGQTVRVRLPFRFLSSGPGRTTIGSIYFQVDPFNSIHESNEMNNLAGPFAVVLE